MIWIQLVMFFTRTRREIFPWLRAVLEGKYSKSSLHRGQISTRLVYLKLEIFDLSSVPMSFLDALTYEREEQFISFEYQLTSDY